MERTTRVIVLAAVALGLAASSAYAGLGGLVKGAKDKAKTVTGTKSTGDSGLQPRKVEFDETMVELTGPLLDRLIAARQKANLGLKDRPALVKRQEEIKTEIDALGAKHGAAITDNENKRGEVQSCMSGELQVIRNRKWEEMNRQVMANPASAEKMLKLTVALNDAQIKGDTAAVSRLTKEAEAMFGATHADSLEAQKKCGAMPPPHPAGLKIGALNSELAQVDAKIRDMDMKALKLQADECDMPETRLAMCWERIEMYLSGRGGFTEKELPALAEHKGALSAALAG